MFDIFVSLKIDFICSISEHRWKDELERKGIDTVKITNPSGDVNEANELLNLLEPRLQAVKLLFIDGNRFKNSYISKLKLSIQKIILIDDLGSPVRDSAKHVWNPNVYANSKLYNKWNGLNYFLGAKYLLLRKEFFKSRNQNKEKLIFVSIGGVFSNMLSDTIKIAIKSFGYSFVFARNFSADKMVESIDKSELTICGASVSLHEVWKGTLLLFPFTINKIKYIL